MMKPIVTTLTAAVLMFAVASANAFSGTATLAGATQPSGASNSGVSAGLGHSLSEAGVTPFSRLPTLSSETRFVFNEGVR